jgi:hypothetical protein
MAIDQSRSVAGSRMGKQHLSINSPGPYEEKEHSKGEVKEILIKKIKDFRDLL